MKDKLNNNNKILCRTNDMLIFHINSPALTMKCKTSQHVTTFG